jgi:hypothetical protein
MTTELSAPRARFALLDLGIVGAGVVAFVFSFVGYYTASVSGITRSTGAWHGFFGWFAAVVALVGAGVVAVARALRGRGVVPPYPGVLVVFVIATASVLAALFTSGYDTSRAHWARVAADTGHGYGYWISLAAIIAGTALALARVVQTGGRLPGGLGGLSSLRPANGGR